VEVSLRAQRRPRWLHRRTDPRGTRVVARQGPV